MAQAITALNYKSHKLLLVGLLLATLALVGYVSYSLAHHSVDLFTIPNPAKGMHQQKPISTPTQATLTQQ